MADSPPHAEPHGEPHVILDPGSLPPAAQKLRGPLEEQLSSAVRVATERIRDEYAGEHPDEVCRRLLATTRELLHPDIGAAFQPDRADLGQTRRSRTC